MATSKSKAASQLVPNDSLRSSDVGDQVLLYDPVADQFFALNLACKLIWESAKGGAEAASIEKTFTSFFGKRAGGYLQDINIATTAMEKSQILIAPNKGVSRTVDTVKFAPHAHPLLYEAPRFITYTSAWMKKNHPSAVLSVKFSDRWGPACD